ncbi:Sensor histidine kinase BtsS [Austwickia sp. TVS 96-490-7B]|uniref:sensor histidine kinase n=1 Tax=Austwickia sp. TVS 96-490-7B TaxID=2830843 RepID=UPI001DEE782B|nr:histidine kinase [Austwickia sp. TVS 96-490-7B]MBW3084904.1 Sensor histidine kinase BtsS [Austwickia sp. TVS 96-490-7B]
MTTAAQASALTALEEVPGWAMITGLALVAAVLILLISASIRRRGRLSSPEARATYQALHVASEAARHLRSGLTPRAAGRAAKDLRPLLQVSAVSLCDPTTVLAWEGVGEHHRRQALDLCQEVLEKGTTVHVGALDLECDHLDCPIRGAILAPVISNERTVAVLASYDDDVSADLVRATEAVADWISTQLDLAELATERERVMEAELRALRAQISPHFIYNSLAAIASFVRTDPPRARELLLEFADFTRYALRASGPMATLSEELENIERYLTLEEARFGERLVVSLMLAPEALSVQVPTLTIQPLVENAVKHGIESSSGVGHISLTARDVGLDAEISIEDDGVGADPEEIRAMLAGERGDHVGLANVDARLRQTFGDDYGLVVETAVGAGTKVTFRVPKYSARTQDR